MGKPVIIVVGLPHSYTSAVSKFLLHNGGYCEMQNHNIKVFGYDNFESSNLMDFVEEKKRLMTKKIHIEGSQTKVSIHKAPLAGFFLEDIRSDSKIKIVYCVRNIGTYLQSSLDKYPHKAAEYFINKASWFHDAVISSPYEVYTFPTEFLLRHKKESFRLLKFCELTPSSDPFKGIVKSKERNASYFKHRISNFFVKRLKWFT